MPYAYLHPPFAALVRAFRHAAFTLGVVVAIAVAGQSLALLLQPAPAPAHTGKAPGVHLREPGLRQPAHSGLRAGPRALEAGFAVDAYDLRAVFEERP